MRSYKAARRAARRAEGGVEPIPFEVAYIVDEIDPATGETVEAERVDTFNAYGEVSSATMTDMAYFADRGIETPEGAGVIRAVFTEAIGDPEEFRRFWRVAPLIDDDTLLEIMGDLIEDTAGRPTTRPSDSPASSSTTGQDSRVASLPGGFSTQATPLASSL